MVDEPNRLLSTVAADIKYATFTIYILAHRSSHTVA